MSYAGCGSGASGGSSGASKNAIVEPSPIRKKEWKYGMGSPVDGIESSSTALTSSMPRTSRVEIGGHRGVVRHVGDVAQHRGPSRARPDGGVESVEARTLVVDRCPGHMTTIGPGACPRYVRHCADRCGVPQSLRRLGVPMAYRVVHYGTGFAGTHALRGIIEHPELELVGLVVHSDEKVGKDAGGLAGLHPTGVVATQDLDAVTGLGADAFCYMATTHGRFKVAIGEVERILASGTNVVTTSFGLLVNPATAWPRRPRHARRRGEARRRVVPVHWHRARVLQRLSAGRAQRLREACRLDSHLTSSPRTGPVSRATRSRSPSAASASPSTRCRPS